MANVLTKDKQIAAIGALAEGSSIKKAYAWSYETEAQTRRSVAVLHIPPIDSPEAAVRAAIVKEVRDIAKAKKSR